MRRWGRRELHRRKLVLLRERSRVGFPSSGRSLVVTELSIARTATGRAGRAGTESRLEPARARWKQVPPGPHLETGLHL